MAQMPIIRAEGQPFLAPGPRADARALDSGRAVADLGGDVVDLALEIDAQRAVEAGKDRENRLRSARVEAVTRLGMARGASDADENVDGLADRFDGQARAIHDDIARRFAGEPELAEDFDLAFEEVAAPHKVGVSARQAKLRGAADRAAYGANMRDLAVQYGATSDPQVQAAIADQAASATAGAVSSGIVTGDEGAKALDGFAGATQAGLYTQLLRDDPEKGLGLLKAGKGDFGPEERQQLIGRFEGAVEKRAGEAERAATDATRAEIRRLLDNHPEQLADQMDAGKFDEFKARHAEDWQMFRSAADASIAARKAREAKGEQDAADAALRALDGQISLVQAKILNGQPIPDQGALAAAAVGTPRAATVSALLADAAAMAEFRLAPPATRARMLARQDRTGVDTLDVRRTELFHQVDQNLRAAEQKDIIGHVLELGAVNVPPVDLGDVASLRTRAALSRDLSAQYDVEARFFSDAEKADALASLKTATVDQKLGMLGAMTTALGPAAATPLSELGMDAPVFAQAGLLAAGTGDMRAARAALTGQALIAGGDFKVPPAVRMPSAAALRTALAPEIARAIDPATLSRVRATADAIYAAIAPGGVEPDDPALAEAYARAQQMALGATFIGDRQFGGIQETNGLAVLLPPGTTADAVADLMASASTEKWQEIARGHVAPTYGDGRELTAEERGRLVLRYVGGHLYQAGEMQSSREVRWLIVPGTGGQYARFDIGALRAGTERPR